MLADLHVALQRLLLERGLLEQDTVAIEFEAPSRTWVGSRTRPTVDLFLYDIEENTDLRQTGVQTTRTNGQGIHRLPPRRFDLRYLVSAVATDIVDEHALLWRTFVTLMKYPTLPAEVLPDSLSTQAYPIAARVTGSETSSRPLEIWNSLESPPRPALVYVVTVPVDLEVAITAPLVFSRTARYASTRDAAQVLERRMHIGGTVVDRRGHPVAGARVWIDGRAREPAVTNAAGEYTLTNVPAAGRAVMGRRPLPRSSCRPHRTRWSWIEVC
jgi:hypothetical protein